jgi:hypothetical protein
MPIEEVLVPTAAKHFATTEEAVYIKNCLERVIGHHPSHSVLFHLRKPAGPIG